MPPDPYRLLRSFHVSPLCRHATPRHATPRRKIPSEPPPAVAMEPAPSMVTELGLPLGFRFVPSDEELVGHCLLPRILGHSLMPNNIIDDDPLSAPPWALLNKHERKHQAFFFAECQAMNARGSRQKRTCVGYGTWAGQGKRKRRRRGREQGQVVDKMKKLRVRVRVQGRAETMEIEWEMYALNFEEHGVKGSTGWVMHEYSITAPREVASSPLRVYCIRFSGHGRNAKINIRDAQHRANDGELEDEEVEEEAGAIGEEEDPALFGDEYPPPPAPQLEYVPYFPAMAADAVNPNPADGAPADAGAGYDQGLDDYMNSLPHLLPTYDFSQ